MSKTNDEFKEPQKLIDLMNILTNRFDILPLLK